MICIYQVLGHSNNKYRTEAKPCPDCVLRSQWEYLFALFLMLLYLSYQQICTRRVMNSIKLSLQEMLFGKNNNLELIPSDIKKNIFEQKNYFLNIFKFFSLDFSFQTTILILQQKNHIKRFGSDLHGLIFL